MRKGVVIEHACESKLRPFVSTITSMAKNTQLCSQAIVIINRVMDYFVWWKKCSGGSGPLK